MEQIRIIKEMHKEYGTVYPRFMVWENGTGTAAILPATRVVWLWWLCKVP